MNLDIKEKDLFLILVGEIKGTISDFSITGYKEGKEIVLSKRIRITSNQKFKINRILKKYPIKVQIEYGYSYLRLTLISEVEIC